MIVYSLRCAKGHVFDEWFASSADFDAKAKSHALKCPRCGDSEIRKAIMAPRVGNSAAAAPAPAAPCATCGQEGGCPWAA